jgi:hypothetical protein
MRGRAPGAGDLNESTVSLFRRLLLILSGASVEGVGRCADGSRSNCIILDIFFGPEGGSDGGSEGGSEVGSELEAATASGGKDGEWCTEGATCCAGGWELGDRRDVILLLASFSAKASVFSWASGDANAAIYSSSVA